MGESAADVISVNTEGEVTSLFFTDGSGDPLPIYGGIDPGVDSGIDTLAGNSILLFASDAEGRTMLGVEESTGHIVFAAYLDPSADLTSAKVWTVQFEPVYNTNPANPDDPLDLGDSLHVAATADLLFSFAGTPSGKNLFTMVGSHTQGLVVTPDTSFR